MVAAGYAIEILFGATGLVPSARNAKVSDAGIGRNYTTWLNIAFLALAAVLLVRFVTSGGLPMLRMMGGPQSRPTTPTVTTMTATPLLTTHGTAAATAP
jgi:uncharacterized protein